jgi:hypothetical protein
MSRSFRSTTTAVVGLSMATACVPARGEAIRFNTDTGVMTVDGNASSTFFGVPMQTSVLNGKMQFRFLGSLVFLSSDVVTATGSRPLSLFVGNDVVAASGATFNFNALPVGNAGILGGGTGGAAGASVAGGGGGTGGNGGAGGGGGTGGTRFNCDTFGCAMYNSGSFGSAGTGGSVGNAGATGKDGFNGVVGGAGFNNAVTVEAGGRGLGAAGGAGGQSPGVGGPAIGVGGAAGSNFAGGGDGFAGFAGFAASSNGSIPSNGTAGTGGFAGTNTNSAFVLTGGSAGAGGGSGGGGGGGGGGAGAGGGSGGGGGGAGGNVVSSQDGGLGGTGGVGGKGGAGGAGTASGAGGRGGNGGGGVEILAQGRVTFAGNLSLRGGVAEGGVGGAGTIGGSGPGSPGSGGGGQTQSGPGGDGGAGGAGGAGSSGARGSAGGNGGSGGGGAGGTILVRSALFNGAGSTIDTSGGTGIGAAGGNGRYVVAHNNAVTPNFGTRTGATFQEFASGDGSGGSNPFIQSGLVTSNVINLDGGADVYGLRSNLATQDLVGGATVPTGAIGMLVRLHSVSASEEYLNQDLIALVNLSNHALAEPALGIGPDGSTFTASLRQQGFANNPAFGGSGPQTLHSLPVDGVFVTLMPSFGKFDLNANLDGFTALSIDDSSFVNGRYFIIPGDANSDGRVSATDFVILASHFNQTGTTVATGDFNSDGRTNALDFNILATNYGASPGALPAALVPEPCGLVTFFWLLAASRRRRPASR